MPGFILAKTIYEMAKDYDWKNSDGIILHNHGIFTFDDDAKKSYDKMIAAVSLAEKFLEDNAKLDIPSLDAKEFDLSSLKEIISKEKGFEVSLKINQEKEALYYASQDNLKENVTKGVLTPEHIIRTKRVPLVLENSDIQTAVDKYKDDYKTYFEKYAKDEICLNKAPNYAVIKDFGIVCFGKDEKEANIINDIVHHTISAVLKSEKLGGYESISEKNSFEMEYWELEQAKLKK
jgi:rhamnose utilization protein RhaD (predicted bifunctional aldolase and dehydrogenase)